jgi:hypothetical protein
MWSGVALKASRPKRKLLVEDNSDIASTIASWASEREDKRLIIELVKFQTISCCGFDSFWNAGSVDSRVWII